jgi:hypothetical protein
VSDEPATPSEPEAAASGADPPGSGPGGAGPAGASGVAAAEAARQAANGRDPEEMSVGQLVFEISDRASVLVREEIELAKTEVSEKVNRLIQGGATAVAAGVFLVAATGAGLYAWRAFKRGAPPTPEMAITEAKEIKAAFDDNEEAS